MSSRLEQETIVLYNEEEKTASIYTHNGAMQRKLLRLCSERPGEVQQTRENDQGGLTFEIPKKWVKIGASRILTDDQREVLRTRFIDNTRINSTL